jgi:hypothetical protein
MVDVARGRFSIVVKDVNGRASLTDGDHLDIEHSDVELAFNSDETAASCLSSVESLQRHLFTDYLQTQRLGEVIKFKR